MERIYLDHNATSPLREEAKSALLDALDRYGGNPSSIHQPGREARQALDEARERVAASLRVHEDEVIFTSGGTESNNLALRGALRSLGPSTTITTTAIEHSAVLSVARELATAEHPLEVLSVDDAGRIDLDKIHEEGSTPRLVSVMAVNNEVGTIADLARIRERVSPSRERVLHTDAVQALGRIPVDLEAWGAQLATFSAHKVGGPVGMGVLVRRSGTPLVASSIGGEQEAGMRAGTENVPAIVAGAIAIELAVREQADFARRTRELSLLLWDRIREALPGVRLVGPPIDAHDRAPNTINVRVPDVDGHVLVTRLDLAGLSVSAGSACASGSLEPSHVLIAMGYDTEEARAGLRISLGRSTTTEDIHNAVDIMRKTLRRQR